MKVQISGQHLDLGESLQEHIQSSTVNVATKYFENPVNASVNLVKEKQHYITADIMVNEGTGRGLVIKASCSDNDAYRAFDEALGKIEKQLRKYKNRIKSHHKNKEERLHEVPKYILSPLDDDHSADQDVPVIIAEMSTKIEKLTVADAVMKMDLLDLPAMMFINKQTGHLNMVYYRKDGNISWVDASHISA